MFFANCRDDSYGKTPVHAQTQLREVNQEKSINKSCMSLDCGYLMWQRMACKFQKELPSSRGNSGQPLLWGNATLGQTKGQSKKHLININNSLPNLKCSAKTQMSSWKPGIWARKATHYISSLGCLNRILWQHTVQPWSQLLFDFSMSHLMVWCDNKGFSFAELAGPKQSDGSDVGYRQTFLCV